jgi:hypothetical protein
MAAPRNASLFGFVEGPRGARSRISSTITDAIVIALRHDRTRSGASCSVAF